jgi:hypothetical protein
LRSRAFDIISEAFSPAFLGFLAGPLWWRLGMTATVFCFSFLRILAGEIANTTQIVGPNPILMCGAKGAWDEGAIEAGDIIGDGKGYYLFYHGIATDTALWGSSGYRIGVATALHPLGPWAKYSTKPILDCGPAGSWDDHGVACAAIVREGPKQYSMYYSGHSSVESRNAMGHKKTTKWGVGLAFAESPLGPWIKYEKNPIIRDFGYVGGVVKRRGNYLLYAEYPIGGTAPDYGPIALATADYPTGPWTVFPGNPVLSPSEVGAWDDGGCSEAKVLYWGGTFHMFYGGAKAEAQRMQSRESIGYAWSRDGLRFQRASIEPIAKYEMQPNASAFAEVHALIEPPFIYAYHTLRYLDRTKVANVEQRTSVLEDIGVQVLAMQRHFKIEMPIIALDRLIANGQTKMADCPSICLREAKRAILIAGCFYEKAANRPIVVRVFGSNDGIAFNTAEILSFELDVVDGKLSAKRVTLETNMKFVKVAVLNQDQQHDCESVRVSLLISR